MGLHTAEMAEKIRELNALSDAIRELGGVHTLPFGANAGCESRGPSAQALKGVNANYRETLHKLARLVDATVAFLQDAQARYETADAAPSGG